MRDATSKHIVGIAIFVVVISTFVIYFAPKSPPEDGFELYSVPPERLQHLEIKAPKKFKVFLNSIQYDETSKRFTAQLDLEWDGTLPSPRELNIDISTITRKARFGRSIYRFALMHPFKAGVRRTIDIGWKDQSFSRFEREPDYFAYAEIDPALDDTTRLLYVERDPLMNAVPLTVIASNKRSDK